MTRIISLVVLVGIVALCAWLVLQVMGQFLLPMFLSVVLVVIFRPLHNWLTERLNGRVRVAAGLTTALILFIVLFPFMVVLTMAATEGVSLARNLSKQTVLADLGELRERFSLEMPGKEIVEEIGRNLTLADSDDETAEQREKLRQETSRAVSDLQPAVKEMLSAESTDDARREQIRTAYQNLVKAVEPWGETATAAQVHSVTQQHVSVRNAFYDLKQAMYGGPWSYRLKVLANPGPAEINQVLRQVDAWLGPMALSTTQYVGGFLARLLVGAAVMVISLYFFLADGPGMVSTIMKLFPLEDRYELEMLDQFGRISRAVVLATLLSAAAQAVLAGLAYIVLDFESVILLTFLTGLMAMVPFVGAASVWIPCSLWLLFVVNRPIAAIGFAIYGGFVVSMADNVIKPYVLHGQSNMHPLMALLSVLGGVQALGPIGIFVGPMIVAFLQALLSILREELIELDQQAAKAGESAIHAALQNPPSGET